jgi:hypothetical protein
MLLWLFQLVTDDGVMGIGRGGMVALLEMIPRATTFTYSFKFLYSHSSVAKDLSG